MQTNAKIRKIMIHWFLFNNTKSIHNGQRKAGKVCRSYIAIWKFRSHLSGYELESVDCTTACYQKFSYNLICIEVLCPCPFSTSFGKYGPRPTDAFLPPPFQSTFLCRDFLHASTVKKSSRIKSQENSLVTFCLSCTMEAPLFVFVRFHLRIHIP